MFDKTHSKYKMIKLKLCQLFYEQIWSLNVAEYPLWRAVSSEQINQMKSRSTTGNNIHPGESGIDQRNTMASWRPWVTTSYFIKCSHSMAWSFSYFISAAQNWTKFTYFVSWNQANIIFSSDLPKLPFCKFEWPLNPQKTKKSVKLVILSLLTHLLNA